MPHRKLRTNRRYLRGALLCLAGVVLWMLRRAPAPAQPSARSDDVPGWASSPAPRPQPRGRRRRLAASLVFATLFFAGASFSAGAGDVVVQLLETEPAAAEADATLTVAAAEAETASEDVEEPVTAPEEAPAPEFQPANVLNRSTPAAAPVSEPAAEEASAPAEPAVEPAPAEPEADVAVEPAAEPAPAAEEPVVLARTPAPLPQAAERAPASKPTAAARKSASPAPAPERKAPLDPEVHHPNTAATVWLHRDLGDPTPASMRLSPEVVRKLRTAARAARVHWSVLLGAVRADGSRHVPSRRATLAQTAQRLSALGARRNAWEATLALTGRTTAADRAVALARYYRAIGPAALVEGLLAQEDELAKKVLADDRVDLYAGGRADIEAGRVDVRVLALIAYLAESYGQVTVSSLFSGHRLYARPGVISAHVYGQAVDISALDGKPIAGNQEPGGLTEEAVRDILLLPAEMLPRQVISLLGLGGPSFPLGDHGDHIHVGF